MLGLVARRIPHFVSYVYTLKVDGIYIFFIVSGVRQTTWYCGHYWPIVPALDDR
jgi:hypothetical protein